MSEARELLERFRKEANEVQTYFRDVGKSDSAYIFGGIVEALRRALATQPEPGAVPELPEWSWQDDEGDLRIRLASKHMVQILDAKLSPGDLNRIAEACTKLAARERARRAGS